MDNTNFQNNGVSGNAGVPNYTQGTNYIQNEKNSGLGVAALILSIIGCTSLIGLILAIVDLAQKNGKKKTLSKVALGICGAWLLIGILSTVLLGAGTKKVIEEVTAEMTEEDSEVETTSENEQTDDTSSEEGTEDSAESKYYFKDLELVTEDYTIKITDWKIIQKGEAGNEYGDVPVIAFWYDTTNTSGTEIDPMSAWIYVVSAYQDNDPNSVNELSVGMLPDDQFTESQLNKIKKDGTVQNAVAYDLSDTETPVKLTAKKSMLGDEIGSMDFDIVNMTYSNTDSVSTKGGGDSSDSKEESDKGSEPSFSDNVIVTKDYTITITDYKVIQPGENGNKYGKKPVIAFWYDTTNTSGKSLDPTSAWIYIMTAVQDNDSNSVNKLSVASLPDDTFINSQLEQIKEGGTVSNAVAYELTDEETPVTLSATNGMLGKSLGEQTFELK